MARTVSSAFRSYWRANCILTSHLIAILCNQQQVRCSKITLTFNASSFSSITTVVKIPLKVSTLKWIQRKSIRSFEETVRFGSKAFSYLNVRISTYKFTHIFTYRCIKYFSTDGGGSLALGIVKYRYVDRIDPGAMVGLRVERERGKLAKDETACRFFPNEIPRRRRRRQADHGKSFMRISDLASLCDAPESRDEFTAENMSITWRDP